MITVALIDDHLIVRSGFAQLLGLEPDLQVVAEFGSGREALAGLPGAVCRCVFAISPCLISPVWSF
ncbi:two-component system response regulator [Escherichia coli]|nr:two-component system response regulator [Escherichia coli]